MKSCIESMDNVELNGNIRSNKHPGCASQCLQQSSFFNISISDVFCIDFRKKERKKEEDSFEAESQWRFPRGLGQRQFARLDNVVANGFESLTNSIEWRHHKLEPNFFNSVLFFWWICHRRHWKEMIEIVERFPARLLPPCAIHWIRFELIAEINAQIQSDHWLRISNMIFSTKFFF